MLLQMKSLCIRVTVMKHTSFYDRVFTYLHNLSLCLNQGSGTCGSFDDGIWLTWYFLNMIVTDETFCNFATKPSATPCSTRSRINSKEHVINTLEYLCSCTGYGHGRSVQRRGKSSSLHSKKFFCFGGVGFLWVTS